MLEESPLEIFRRRVFRFLNTSRLGWPGGIVIVALVAVWVGWGTISTLPGIEWALTRGRELLPLPKAHGDRFSIALPRLENDPGGIHRRLISDALRSQFSNDEIEVLLVDRTITIEGSERPQEAVKKGHDQALELLRQTQANVMIWGESLDVKPDAPLRLHWTLNSTASPGKTSEKYRLSAVNYDLPDLFRHDLDDVLSLLANTESAAFNSQRGQAVADRLPGFIEKVGRLVSNTGLVGKPRAVLDMALADALQTYGDQRGDRQALERAVAAYQDALKVFTREQMPLEWAAAQAGLGVMLDRLGERESGAEHLTQSVAAFQESLKERTRERMPGDWARTQVNLANTLVTLGERESGTERFAQAVAAYREALKEITRKEDPLNWAATQIDLGNALWTWGDREIGTEHLTQAVTALQEALKERTRDRTPLEWAGAQNNLGNVLSTLGERESGTERLTQAVSAYEEALKEFKRERVPLQWAITQNNLGSALQVLGERESGTEQLTQAMNAYQAALKELTRERDPLQWAAIQTNLGNVLVSLGQRENGTERLTQAVATYQEALKERTRERLPMDWAGTQYHLGNTLLLLGEPESGTKRLTEAVSAYQNALEELTEEHSTYYHGVVERALEKARQVLANRSRSESSTTK